MFAFSLNIDPEKLKDASKKHKSKKKGTKKTRKNQAQSSQPPSKDNES
jgi:hypothetical protein